MWLLYKKENKYESIHVSCFKRKLGMNVKNDGADFGYLNVSSHVVCFWRDFFAGKHVFHIKAIAIYKCLVVQTIFTYWKNIIVLFLNRLTTIIILWQW